MQAGRQIRFSSVEEIRNMRAVLTSYISNAVKVQKSGLKVEFKKTMAFRTPEEFQSKLAGSPALKAAFEALTPGRQRAYLLHFSDAKQSKTRESRIEKVIPQILEGKGLTD